MSIAQEPLLAFFCSRAGINLVLSYEIAPQNTSNESFMSRAEIAQEPPARLLVSRRSKHSISFCVSHRSHLLAVLASRLNKPVYFSSKIAPQNALNESFIPHAKISQETPARPFGLALE
jgi:hypothetical protein